MIVAPITRAKLAVHRVVVVFFDNTAGQQQVCSKSKGRERDNWVLAWKKRLGHERYIRQVWRGEQTGGSKVVPVRSACKEGTRWETRKGKFMERVCVCMYAYV